MSATSTSQKSDGTAALPLNLDDYHVVNLLGHGAGSTIYTVCRRGSLQRFALKHVVCHTDREVRLIEQLRTEMEVGQHVTHPGLRRSIDFCVHRTWLWAPREALLLLELAPGAPLQTQAPAALTDLIDCFIQVAKALHSLHQSGFAHCDLKPNNILLTPAGEVTVIDLGQACPLGTKKPRIQGTPDYIAPEQVHCQPCDARTDVYNFGATLYWALCHKNFPTLYTLSREDNSFLLDARIPSPHDVNPVVPQTLSNLVMECVRIKPDKRPQSMEDVARRLEIIYFSLTHRLPHNAEENSQPHHAEKPQPLH